MADQSKKPAKPAASSKKNQEGTVLLTPEELRALSGGQSVVNKPPPIITPNALTKPGQ